MNIPFDFSTCTCLCSEILNLTSRVPSTAKCNFTCVSQYVTAPSYFW